MELLLKHGTNAKADNSSALRIAAKEGEAEAVQLLLDLEHGAGQSI